MHKPEEGLSDRLKAARMMKLDLRKDANISLVQTQRKSIEAPLNLLIANAFADYLKLTSNPLKPSTRQSETCNVG